MVFKPGTSGNPSGRPKGSPNRNTEQIRERLQQFIDDNLETLQQDFDKLEPKDRISFLEKMLKHILPAPLNELEKLSEEQLQELIKRLKSGEV